MKHDPASLTRETFAGIYANPKAPWDIGRPQQAFVESGDAIRGRVIDIGCGTGELSLWLAEKGCAVTGIDFLSEPLDVAKQKAAERGLEATFLVMDATHVGTLPAMFDCVTDCGLFHVFDDAGRAAYVSALTRLLTPGSRIFLLCFSDAEPGTHGPRRVSESELRSAFSSGWVIQQITPARFECVEGMADASFTPGGAQAWFAEIQKQ